MKRIYLIVFIVSLTASGVRAQESYNLVKMRAWEHVEDSGDLNGDGIADLAVIAVPDDTAHLLVRDDGYVYNFNQPLLAIYFGDKKGGYTLWRGYNDVVPARPDEVLSITPSLKITPRRTLIISLEYFATMGGWDAPTYNYTFRLQDGDFYLIGRDEEHRIRNTGEVERESYNYLTHKKQHITDSFNKRVKPRERWTSIPKEPLKPLGSFTLGE